MGEHLKQEVGVVGGEAVRRAVGDAPRALELGDQRLDAGALVVVPGDVVGVIGAVGEEHLDRPVDAVQQGQLPAVAFERADHDDADMKAQLTPAPTHEVDLGGLPDGLPLRIDVHRLPLFHREDGVVEVGGDPALDDVERLRFVQRMEHFGAVTRRVDPHAERAATSGRPRRPGA
ncbi:MAG: hypothetical protein QM820_39030 [Minicystis sp.]